MKSLLIFFLSVFLSSITWYVRKLCSKRVVKHIECGGEYYVALYWVQNLYFYIIRSFFSSSVFIIIRVTHIIQFYFWFYLFHFGRCYIFSLRTHTPLYDFVTFEIVLKVEIFMSLWRYTFFMNLCAVYSSILPANQ